MSLYMQVWVGGRWKNTWKHFSVSLESTYVDKVLALCDSWSVHKDEQVLLKASGGKDVDLRIIASKTTKYAQPLNVYFFRQYKIYAKSITDFIKLRSCNMQPKLHVRFFTMKWYSVIYKQLSAEAYRPRVRKSRYWGETLQVPHPLLWRNKDSLLDQWRTMHFPLVLFAYTVCCRRTKQCFSVLRTHKSDVVDGSSGRHYVTDQWHNVPLLRARDIDQCFVTCDRTLATILVNPWTTSQVSLTWRSALILWGT